MSSKASDQHEGRCNESARTRSRPEAFAKASRFRGEFYACLTARRDELLELCDAVLCADGAVKSLVGLTLLPEHRRGHGALYGGLNEAGSMPAACAGRHAAAPLRRRALGAGGRCVAVAAFGRAVAAGRLFCHVYGRAKSASQFIPGWPYSFVAVLESGAASWTSILDAVRLGPSDDATAATAAQLRDVVGRLISAGQWKRGDPDITIVTHSGFDVTRLALVLRDLPVAMVGRIPI